MTMGIMEQKMIIMDKLMTTMGNNMIIMVKKQDMKIQKINQIIKQQTKFLINLKNKRRNLK